MSQLGHLEIHGVWSKQKGPLIHFTVHVPEYLNEVFPGRWIFCGSALLPEPVEFPARNADLWSCDKT